MLKSQEEHWRLQVNELLISFCLRVRPDWYRTRLRGRGGEIAPTEIFLLYDMPDMIWEVNFLPGNELHACCSSLEHDLEIVLHCGSAL